MRPYDLLVILLSIAILLGIYASADGATAPCNLKWNPNPIEDEVTHYRVWRGIDLVATVEGPRASVPLPADQASVLTVTAVNATGESEPSDPIEAVPITPMESDDLAIWRKAPVFFVARKPRQFFRFSFPLPNNTTIALP